MLAAVAGLALAGPAAAQGPGGPLPAVPAPPGPAVPQVAAPPAALPAAPAPGAGLPAAPGGRVPGRVVMFQKPAADGGQPPSAPLTEPRPLGPGAAQDPPQEKGPAKLDAQGKGETVPQSLPTNIDTYGTITREKAFRLESSDQLLRRLAEELAEEDRDRLRRRPDPSRNPPTPADYKPPESDPLVPAGTPYQAKTGTYPAMKALVEPGYVVHRRLYFEEPNSERYGWELGIAQPVVSTLAFYKDTLLWPAKLASYPLERYDTSAGRCRPGDPVPYLLYPPQIDVVGATAGAGVIVGAAALFP